MLSGNDSIGHLTIVNYIFDDSNITETAHNVDCENIKDLRKLKKKLSTGHAHAHHSGHCEVWGRPQGDQWGRWISKLVIL